MRTLRRLYGVFPSVPWKGLDRLLVRPRPPIFMRIMAVNVKIVGINVKMGTCRNMLVGG